MYKLKLFISRFVGGKFMNINIYTTNKKGRFWESINYWASRNEIYNFEKRANLIEKYFGKQNGNSFKIEMRSKQIEFYIKYNKFIEFRYKILP